MLRLPDCHACSLSAIKALKLAERTIQFADVKGILCDGYIRAGRVTHRESSLQDAASHFTKAKEARKDSVLATIGLAIAARILGSGFWNRGVLVTPMPAATAEADGLIMLDWALPVPGMGDEDSCLGDGCA